MSKGCGSIVWARELSSVYAAQREDDANGSKCECAQPSVGCHRDGLCLWLAWPNARVNVSFTRALGRSNLDLCVPGASWRMPQQLMHRYLTSLRCKGPLCSESSVWPIHAIAIGRQYGACRTVSRRLTEATCRVPQYLVIEAIAA